MPFLRTSQIYFELEYTMQSSITKVFMTHHIRAIHGDITVPPEPGSASGTYQVDVSKYILGWMVGTEWFPDAGSLEVDFPH